MFKDVPNDPNEGILNKLIQYITLRDGKVDPGSTLILELKTGACSGYSAIWGFGKNLSLGKPRLTGGIAARDDAEWFYSVIDTLAQWDGKSLPIYASGNDIEIERLLSLLMYFQMSFEITGDGQDELQSSMEQYAFDGQTTATISKPQNGMRIVGNLRLPQLIALLPEAIKDGTFVMLGANDHTSAITCHSGKFFFFDPDAKNANLNSTVPILRPADEPIDAAEAARRIFAAHACDINSTLTLVVKAFNWHDTLAYPRKAAMLEDARYFFHDSTMAESTTGNTAVFEATRARDVDSLRYWLKATKQINKPNRHGFTPLFIAAKENILRELGVLVEQDDIDVNVMPYDATAKQVKPPLFMAACNGYPDAVRKILSHRRCEPNRADPDDLITPLYVATDRGHTAVVAELLSDERVDPNIATRAGVTPLVCAILLGFADIVKLYMACERVDLDKTTFNHSPFHLALRNGTVAVKSVFLAGHLNVIVDLFALLAADGDSIVTLQTLQHLTTQAVIDKVGISGAIELMRGPFARLGTDIERQNKYNPNVYLMEAYQKLSLYFTTLVLMMENAKAIGPSAFDSHLQTLTTTRAWLVQQQRARAFDKGTNLVCA